jgi:hypothetical protein
LAVGLLAFAGSSLPGQTDGSATAERPKRLALVAGEMKKVLEKFEADLARPKARPTVRDLTYGALTHLLLDPGDQAGRRAEVLLRWAFDLQDMDPKSPHYGTVPWRANDPSISDANAIEFTLHPIGPLLVRFGARLRPECRKYLEPHLRAGIAALRRHKVGVRYTNIFLMKCINLVLLGEYLKDRQAADDGYAMLDEWLAYTRRYGVSEYASPTYYSVDLHSLGAGYLCAARREDRARFQDGLDYLWADISAHFLKGRSNGGGMVGPHSRDYDFLGGAGGLTLYTFVEGYQPDIARGYLNPGLEKAMVLLTLGKGGYHPGPRLRVLASLPERVVQGRWGPNPGQDRYVWLTPHFALGSTSADYGPQDKPIALDWVSAKPLPTLQVVPDVFDQPYGKVKVTGKDGHSKPRHLPLHPTCVQEKGTLLALLDLDPAGVKEEVASLATNVILPARADALYLADKKVEGGKPFKLAVAAGQVVGVREGRAGVAVRFFRADGCAGRKAVTELKADARELRYGAARLAAYHYRGLARQLSDRHVRAGLLILAGRCDTDAQLAALIRQAAKARIDEKADADKWEVSAHVGDLLLEAGRDLKKRRPLYRRVNGRQVKVQGCRVNGTELSRMLGQAD